jgi:hypothetical protein
VRRSLAESQGLNEWELRSIARVHYLKVAELQHRGLLHFHLILRVDGADGPESPPPAWLTDELLASAVERTARSFEVRTKDGATYRWGTQLQIEPISVNDGDDRRAASYLAKYATKTTDGSAALARRFRARREIQTAQVSEHLKTMVLTAWDLGGEREHRELNLRSFAHCLGYRGHLLTKSRGYSTTFGQLRSARAEHQRIQHQSDPIEGSFSYQDRGYESPDAERLAEVIFAARQELKKARFRSRLIPDAIPNFIPNAPDLGERFREISGSGTKT